MNKQRETTNKKVWYGILPFYLFTFLLFSCEMESYETGQGEYSLMQADLCELTVNGQQQGSSFVTDDGDAYNLNAPYTAKWIQTADTIYRTLIYYNKVAASQAEVVAMGQTPTLIPLEHWRFKELTQDPLGIESAWISKNKKYLNMALLIKSGKVNDEEPAQIIGLAQDTLLTHPDGRRTAYYRFLHSQNDVPEYYTNRRYVSILLPSKQRPDTIRLHIQTYNGPLERVFIP
jgi:hypothetical protein